MHVSYPPFRAVASSIFLEFFRYLTRRAYTVSPASGYLKQEAGLGLETLRLASGEPSRKKQRACSSEKERQARALKRLVLTSSATSTALPSDFAEASSDRWLCALPISRGLPFRRLLGQAVCRIVCVRPILRYLSRNSSRCKKTETSRRPVSPD